MVQIYRVPKFRSSAGEDYGVDNTPKGSIVQLILEDVVAKQRLRLASLQTAIDAPGWKLAKEISMPTVEYAWAALNTYTEEWFEEQLYSRGVLAAIAQSLIDAAASWTFVDTSLWAAIVKNNGGEVR